MRITWLFFGLWALTCLGLAAFGGSQHDYVSYLDQWLLVRDGLDPWATNNAYGPLHNIFAWLVPVSPAAPKITTATLFIAAAAFLLRALERQRPGETMPLAIFVAAIAGNALIIVTGFAFGLNDTPVAALILFAVFARMNRHFGLAGMLLGLAVLDKYYPALLVPFFLLDDRRIEPRLLLTALLTVATGIVIAVLIWGDAYVEAIRYGISRDALMLSVLTPIAAYARLNGDPWGIVAFLIHFNGPILIAVWGVSFAWVWLRREHWLVGATWSLLLLFLTYKVGNQQFYMSWLVLVAALPLARRRDADRLALVAMPFAFFLSLFQLGYVVLEPHYYLGALTFVGAYAGIPAFALGLATIIWHLHEPANPAPPNQSA